MIALDTNVLARYLLNDDAGQARAAAHLLVRKQTFTAPLTVMLELVWVLKVNGCARETPIYSSSSRRRGSSPLI